MRETDLYPAIKAFLEAQGFEVKSEICSCDVVGVRENEEPVIIELKTGFTLPLVLQGVDRLGVSDKVYLAFGIDARKSGGAGNSLWRRHRKPILKMLRRLGLGLISVRLDGVHEGFVEVHLDPKTYVPRKNRKRAGRLLREFGQRIGDPNQGGITRRTIITAYRQDGLRCLYYLSKSGPAKLADIRQATGVERAGGILQSNHYGWFERVERGVYQITPKGVEALDEFAEALATIDLESKS